jgi:hypothetical protein
MVSFGCVGAIAVLGMNMFAIPELIERPERADAGLIELGIAVGTAFVVYYGYASYKFFRSSPNNALNRTRAKAARAG